jgi:hypothetical protein
MLRSYSGLDDNFPSIPLLSRLCTVPGRLRTRVPYHLSPPAQYQLRYLGYHFKYRTEIKRHVEDTLALSVAKDYSPFLRRPQESGTTQTRAYNAGAFRS